MSKLDDKVVEVTKTITLAWTTTHPDIPSRKIALACETVIATKMFHLLDGLGAVADNDPSRVTKIEITVDWENEIDAVLSAMAGSKRLDS